MSRMVVLSEHSPLLPTGVSPSRSPRPLLQHSTESPPVVPTNSCISPSAAIWEQGSSPHRRLSDEQYPIDSNTGVYGTTEENRSPVKTTTTTNGDRGGGSSGATFAQTVVNLMKTCMGTGCLGLPLATRQAGIVAYLVGILLIALWNIYAVERLVACRPHLPPPREGAKSSLASPSRPDSWTLQGSTTQVTSPSPPAHVLPFHHRPQDASVIVLESVAHLAHHHRPQQDEHLHHHHSPTFAPVPGAVERVESSISNNDQGNHTINEHNNDDTSIENMTQLGRVAYHAFGKSGWYVMNCFTLTLFLGIIVAYCAAIMAFLADTPWLQPTLQESRTEGDDAQPISPSLSLVVAAGLVTCLTALSLVPDVGFLSKFSAGGLMVLALSFFVVFGYGFVQAFGDGWPMATVATPRLLWWPASAAGLSQYFGVVVFGFGTVPLTYNFQDSMAEPHRMVEVSTYALTLTAVTYMILGVGLYALYPDVSDDIIHELPKSEAQTLFSLPVLVRIMMAMVLVVTAPLLIVPAAELVDGLLPVSNCLAPLSCHNLRSTSDHIVIPPNEPVAPLQVRLWNSLLYLLKVTICNRRVWIRFMITVAATLIVVMGGGGSPDGRNPFVPILSLVGCACVGVVSFVGPPLLHCRLRQRHNHTASRQASVWQRISATLADRGSFIDVVMIIGGITATILATYINLA